MACRGTTDTATKESNNVQYVIILQAIGFQVLVVVRLTRGVDVYCLPGYPYLFRNLMKRPMGYPTEYPIEVWSPRDNPWDDPWGLSRDFIVHGISHGNS